jgi:hypothetical protein
METYSSFDIVLIDDHFIESIPSNNKPNNNKPYTIHVRHTHYHHAKIPLLVPRRRTHRVYNICNKYIKNKKNKLAYREDCVYIYLSTKRFCILRVE